MLLQKTLLCWWIFVYVLGYSFCCDRVCRAINAEEGGDGCLRLCETTKETGANFCPALCSKLFDCANCGSPIQVCEGACNTAYANCNLGKETVCLTRLTWLIHTVWSVNDGLSGNLRKPPRRFPAGFRQVSGFFLLIKKFGNLFRRFPDNPSLTDHTVHRFYPQNGISTLKYHFWPKNDGEKWSIKIYFEFPPCGKMVIFVILGILWSNEK